MRRCFLVLVTVIALAGVAMVSGPAIGQVPRDEQRGIRLDGLRRRPGGPCGTVFEIVASSGGPRTRCTHGPDPAPDGIDVGRHREFAVAAPATVGGRTLAAAQPGIPCVGTGADGYRVQLLYARRTGTTNRLGALYPSFVTWASAATTVFSASAAKTGGVRNIRYVTDASCGLVITPVEVSAAGLVDFGTFIMELQSQGFTRSDRKYLAWTDANAYCGIGEVYGDDSPSTTPGLPSSNANNANPLVPGMFARVDNGCWGMANSVEAHEVVHNLGGVQASAPNATQGMHCTDESDRMCYLDGTPPGAVFQRCNGPDDENRLDCNNDDYFNTSPSAGSYLATHWNVANSAFLTNANAPPTSPVVVALAGEPDTQRVMGEIAAAFNGSVIPINGGPTTVLIFNIPAS